MILLVGLEVLCKFADTLAEDRDLNFRAAGRRPSGAGRTGDLGDVCRQKGQGALAGQGRRCRIERRARVAIEPVLGTLIDVDLHLRIFI